MTETLYSGSFVNLKKNANWEYVERVNDVSAVVIMAVLPNQELLLVEQFRPPVNCSVIELPAGLVGDDSPENFLDAARRELFEETGYVAEKWQHIVSGPLVPGISSECIHLLAASGLNKTGDGGGVLNENITVHKVPWLDFEDWIKTKQDQGYMIDPKVYTLWFYASSLGATD